MYEVELKIKVSSLEDVRLKLRSLGAELRWKGIQEDTYYSHPCRDFSQTDEAIRLRRTGDGSVELTYKGPRRGGNAKIRYEVNIPIDPDFEKDVRSFLEHIGFSKSFRIVKRREIYLWKNICINLDFVEGLGPYVELELLSPHSFGDVFEEVIRRLNLRGERTTRSYLELFINS